MATPPHLKGEKKRLRCQGVVNRDTGHVPDSPPDSLIFDFDGLILDTESSAFQSIAEIYREHDLELDLATWQSIIGSFNHPHWVDVLETQLGRPLDHDSLEKRRTRRKLDLLAPEVLRPGVRELISEAHALGIPLAIASSSPIEWVAPHLERFDLLRHFDHIATRTDVGCDPLRTKPAPDIYLLAIEGLDVNPSTSVALEDSPNGVRAAKSAGLWCVAVPGPVTRGLPFTDADLELETLEGVGLSDLQLVAGSDKSGDITDK